jgi:hypothetical protein
LPLHHQRREICSGGDQKQPCGVASDVPLQILLRIDEWQRNAHGGKVLMERDSDSPTALLRLGSSG